MIVIYTTPGCTLCKKTKQWFKEHEVSYQEENIYKTLLDKNRIKDLFLKFENNLSFIVDKNCQIVQDNRIDFEKMDENERIKMIQQNPSIVSRPILFADTEDETEMIRSLNFHQCPKTCVNYLTCGKYRSSLNM